MNHPWLRLMFMSVGFTFTGCRAEERCSSRCSKLGADNEKLGNASMMLDCSTWSGTWRQKTAGVGRAVIDSGWTETKTAAPPRDDNKQSFIPTQGASSQTAKGGQTTGGCVVRPDSTEIPCWICSSKSEKRAGTGIVTLRRGAVAKMICTQKKSFWSHRRGVVN